MKNSNTIITVGLDLGDKQHHLCVLNAEGDVVEEAIVENEATAISTFFERFKPASLVRTVMETGTHSPWISRLLDELGFEVLVGNARKLRAIWQSDRKDDERDAEMLARIGRFDPRLLSPIRHRGAAAQADLSRFRARHALVRARTSLINCARGLVKASGSRLPACSAGAFSKKAVDHVPEDMKPAVLPLLVQIKELTKQIRAYDRQIELLAENSYPETKALQAINGVGPLTALAFVLTIEEPNRFKKNRAVGAFLGLVPKRSQSGETDKKLGISKAGDHYLRYLLTQAAHYILGPFAPECNLRHFGESLVARGGRGAKGRAVTAVCRKLSVLMLHLWKSGDTYEPFHKRKDAKKKKQSQPTETKKSKEKSAA